LLEHLISPPGRVGAFPPPAVSGKEATESEATESEATESPKEKRKKEALKESSYKSISKLFFFISP
jgi:ribosomal protein L12E/L44/L45/RPP1/RPP2